MPEPGLRAQPILNIKYLRGQTAAQTFVLRAVSRINFDVLTADLSSEDRAWVNIANVA